MRIEQLECLIAIHKHHSINTASNELHLTPQAVSSSIKNLEKELDVPLLLRSSKYSLLTEQGKELVDATQCFLDRVKKIKQNNMQSQTLSSALKGDVSIYSTAGLIDSLLPKLICHFLKISPQLNISLHQQLDYELYKTICYEENAFGISFFGEQFKDQLDDEVRDQLQFIPLFPCKFIAQIPLSNPLSSYQSVSLKSLLNYPLILNDAQANIVDILESFGEIKQIIYEPNRSIWTEMLSQGLGVSLGLMIPFETTNVFMNSRFRNVPIKDDISVDCCYVLKKDFVYGDHVQSFLYELSNVLNKTIQPFASYVL